MTSPETLVFRDGPSFYCHPCRTVRDEIGHRKRLGPRTNRAHRDGDRRAAAVRRRHLLRPRFVPRFVLTNTGRPADEPDQPEAA